MAVIEEALRIKDEATAVFNSAASAAESYASAQREAAAASKQLEQAQAQAAAQLAQATTRLQDLAARGDAVQQLANRLQRTKAEIADLAKITGDQSLATQAASAADKEFAGAIEKLNAARAKANRGASEGAAAAKALATAEGTAGDAAALAETAVEGLAAPTEDLGGIAKDAAGTLEKFSMAAHMISPELGMLVSGLQGAAKVTEVFGATAPLVVTALGAAGAAVATYIGVMNDYTAAKQAATHATQVFATALEPLDAAIDAARAEQETLNAAIESGTPKKYLQIADISAQADAKEAEATKTLREELDGLMQQYGEMADEGTFEAQQTKSRIDEINQQLATIHQKANELARLGVANFTTRQFIDGLDSGEKGAGKKGGSSKNDDDEAARAAKRAYDALVAFNNEMIAGADAQFAKSTDQAAVALKAFGDVLDKVYPEKALTQSEQLKLAEFDLAEAHRRGQISAEQYAAALHDLAERKKEAEDVRIGEMGVKAIGITGNTAGAMLGGDLTSAFNGAITQIGAAIGDPAGQAAASAITTAISAIQQLGEEGASATLAKMQKTIDNLTRGVQQLPTLVAGLPDKLGAFLPAVVEAALRTIPAVGDMVEGLDKAVGSAIPKLIESLIRATPTILAEFLKVAVMMPVWVAEGLFNGITQWWTDIGGLSGILDALAQAIKDALATLFGDNKEKTGLFQKNGFFANAGRSIGHFAEGAADSIGDWVGSFATGGYIDRTGLALVHQGERVIPAHGGGTGTATHMRAGGGAVHYHFHLSGFSVGTPEQLRRELARTFGPGARRNLNLPGVG